MTMVELLENDRERLIGDLENSPQPEQAQEILEKEMDQLLYRYNETEKQEICLRTASDMIEVCRMGLPLVDSVGDNVVWTAGDDAQAGKAVFIPICLLAAGAAVLLFVLSGKGMSGEMPVLLRVITAAGFALAFAGGLLLGKNMKKENKSSEGRHKVENRTDAGGLYRKFRGLIQTVDQSIERAANREKIYAGTGLTYGNADGIDEGELSLYAGLLEALYSNDGETALDSLENIRYFLHCNNIETVDYETDKKEWFDVMPSVTQATIRPALVSDGVILRKGLAAGGL
ncbi:MAG: hypothetical protein IJ123_09900 [Blautia sp.]|nr:hypothetical protein [Blautia sp.]